MFGRFWASSESLAEFGRVRERLGQFGITTVWEPSGEFELLGVWESLGEFGIVLEHFGELGRFRESSGEFMRVWDCL